MKYKLTPEDHDLVVKSGLFDPKWYLENYTDVVKSGLDPHRHYLIIGIFLDRNPNSAFDALFYRRTRELRDDEYPVLHFIKNGMDYSVPTKNTEEKHGDDQVYDRSIMGYIDYPQENERVGGDYINIGGWCSIRGEVIEKVTARLTDSKKSTLLEFGKTRVDVKNVFPNFKHFNVGFIGHIYPDFTTDESVLTVTIESISGTEYKISCKIKKNPLLNEKVINKYFCESALAQKINNLTII